MFAVYCDAPTRPGWHVMSRWCCYWWWCCCYCGNPNSTGGSSTGFGITSGISALLSLVVVTGAISTGEWLLTEEKLPRSPSANSSVEPDSRLTYSGLWKFCVAISKLFHLHYHTALHYIFHSFTLLDTFSIIVNFLHYQYIHDINIFKINTFF